MKLPFLLLSALITISVTSCSTDSITTEDPNATTSDNIESTAKRRIIINKVQENQHILLEDNN